MNTSSLAPASFDRTIEAFVYLDQFRAREMEDGEDWFYCFFCDGIGLFPNGNAGIPHTHECAVSLAMRLYFHDRTSPLSFFDALAYQDLQAQLLALVPSQFRGKTIEIAGHSVWVPVCPFCQAQGSAMEHTAVCPITCAYQERDALSVPP